MPDKYTEAITKLVAAAQQGRHRYLLSLRGDQAWLEQRLAMVLHVLQPATAVCLGDYATGAQLLAESSIRYLTAGQASQLLGTETDLLIVDARNGFNPNSVAAASGSVVGGGLMVLIVPDTDQWADYQDPDYQRMLVHPFAIEQLSQRFLQRLQTTLQADSRVLSLRHNSDPSAVVFADSPQTMPASDDVDTPCVTPDQARCVAAILRVSNGHAKRPLLIRADRGRGKSTALGIAAARLMQEKPLSIILTAPRPEAADACFAMAAQLLEQQPAERQQRLIQLAHSPPAGVQHPPQFAELRFIAIDELLRGDYPCDLLLVDEAAGLPVPLLSQLLQQYTRMVFSTTVHGYEGSGQGFDIRFKALLEDQLPQYRSLSLDAPIRWAANDPLEQWIFKAFLLSAEPCESSELQATSAAECRFEKINRNSLLATPDLLRQLFGLLVSAHYQTSPNDLRTLLDGPNISLWLGRVGECVVAVAMLADEGELDNEIATEIWRGQRRPRGHLMAQTLSAHTGLQEAPQLRYRRVIRIAVHPALRRGGLGSKLMAEIIQQARRDQIDCLGTSFAATADVVAFWQALEFIPARLGVSRDSSSGCFSALMMCALSAPGAELLCSAQQRFVEHFCFSLDRCYQQLETDLVLGLLRHCGDYPGWVMVQQDWLDIESFAKDYRQLSVCVSAVWKFVGACLSDTQLCHSISGQQQHLLVKYLLQNESCGETIKQLRLLGFGDTLPTGKKQLEQQLRQVVGMLRDAKLLVQNHQTKTIDPELPT